MTIKDRAKSVAVVAHPDRGESNGFVQSFAYDMIYLAVQEERKWLRQALDGVIFEGTLEAIHVKDILMKTFDAECEAREAY